MISHAPGHIKQTSRAVEKRATITDFALQVFGLTQSKVEHLTLKDE